MQLQREGCGRGGVVVLIHKQIFCEGRLGNVDNRKSEVRKARCSVRRKPVFLPKTVFFAKRAVLIDLNFTVQSFELDVE